MRGTEGPKNEVNMKAEEMFAKQDAILIHCEHFHSLGDALFNMGLLSVATLLMNKGYKILCLNPQQIYTFGNEELLKVFRLYDPAVVGFYVLADNMFMVKELAELVKQANKNIKVVAGGPQACALEGKLLEDKNFDIVITGEGEYTLAELMEHLTQNKGELKDIKGIIYRDGDKIVTNEPRPYIENLDELPVPNLGLALHSKNYYPIVTGRGCPYNCVFCFKAVHGNKYRYRSVDSVVNEIMFASQQLNFNVINFLDDTFTTNPERTKEICRRLIEYQKTSKKNLVLFCEARVDVLTNNPDVLEIMAQAGFERIQIGIESGNQEILDGLDKKTTLKQITDVVAKCYELDIASVFGNFIIGSPGETKKTVEDSIKFAEKLIDIAPGMMEVNASFLTPYAKTPISDDPEKYGLKILDTDFKTGLSMLGEPHIQTKALVFRDLNNLKVQLLSRANAHMMSKIPSIHPAKIAKHFRLARHMGCMSYWYAGFYSSMPALSAFFNFSFCPRFTILNGVESGAWRDVHPIRTIANIVYEPWDDSILITGSFKELRLTHKMEKELYRFAAGKLKAGDIVKEIKTMFDLKEDEDAIWLEKAKPFYAQLEKAYYIAFYS